MSRYLDYDSVISSELWDFKCSIGDIRANGYFDALDDAMELIETLPLTEIIHCKECRYYKRILALTDKEVPENGICGKLMGKTSRTLMPVKPENFCCFAKRKENKNE